MVIGNEQLQTNTYQVQAGGSLTIATSYYLDLLPGIYSGRTVSVASETVGFDASSTTPAFSSSFHSTAGDVSITSGASSNDLFLNDEIAKPGVISATGGKVIISTTGDLFVYSLTIDSDTAVNISTNYLSIQGNLSNSTTHTPWTVTSPTVYLDDGYSLSVSGASLTIHTNNLNLGNGGTASTSISASGVTIDDNGGTVFTNTGLSINPSPGVPQYIRSSGSPVVINVTASAAYDQLTFRLFNNSATLIIDGAENSTTYGVKMTATSEIQISAGVTLENSTSSGPWVMTAPSVQLGDGSKIDTTTGSSPTSLAIHTNLLTLGDNSSGSAVTINGKGVTVDDNFTGSAGGVEIAIGSDGVEETINATSGALSISAAFNSASIADFGGNGILQFESTNAVNVSAKGQITDNTSLINDASSGGPWSMTAPTVTFDNNAEVTVQNNTLAVHTNSLQLFNGDQSPGHLLEADSGLAVDDQGGSVFSATGLTVTVADGFTATLSTNGQPASFSSTGTLLFQTVSGGAATLQFANATGVSLTAPTVEFTSGAKVNVESTNLDVHTNTLSLSCGNCAGQQVSSNGMTIDDNGSPVFSTTGLTIETTGSGYLNGTNYPVTINATGNSGVKFEGDGSTLNLRSGSEITSKTVTLGDGLEFYSTSTTNIHTNNLDMGDGTSGNTASLVGANLSIDDNGGTVFSTTGLTISIPAPDTGGFNPGGYNEFIQVFGSGSPFAMSSSTTLTIKPSISQSCQGSCGTAATLTINSSTGVSISARTGIAVDLYTTLQNSGSNAAWILTAPQVSAGTGAIINTTNSGGASLAIHTNLLQVGGGDPSANTSTIEGNGITIDDNGGSVFSTTGLTVEPVWVHDEYINATTGNLVINANASQGSSLLITDFPNTSLPGHIFLDGAAVSISANNKITIATNFTLTNNQSSGNWTLTAPTVQLNDAAVLNTTTGTGPASLTIHTNNLNLGDGSNGSSTSITGNGNVTIDDTGMANPGVTVTAYGGTQYIYAVTVPASGGNSAIPGILSLNSSGTLLFAAVHYATVALDGDAAVNLSSQTQVTVSGNVFLQNQYSTGGWTLTAPTVQLNDGGAVDVAHWAGNPYCSRQYHKSW